MNFEEKRGYSLKELAMQVPLSVPFLRKEISRGKLKRRKFGDRVIVLAEDWNDYLAGDIGDTVEDDGDAVEVSQN